MDGVRDLIVTYRRMLVVVIHLVLWSLALLLALALCLASCGEDDSEETTAEPVATADPVTRGPIGWIEQNDGRVALGAAVPLGVLNARVAEYLAAINAHVVQKQVNVQANNVH
jgi:hypothetical protein